MKPSDKIKEIAGGELGLNQISSYEISQVGEGTYIKAILQYLDEEYEKNACSRGEHDYEVWNDNYLCKKCHIFSARC